jgi:RNA polymerase sigma-70 factor, ECF subfamily
VTTTYPRLVAALTLISESRAAAEDSVQEALARAWERERRGEQIDSLPAWVTTVSLNLARSRLRRLRTERRAKGRLGEGELPRSELARTQDRIDVRRALRSIPRREREVTVLRYYLGMDVREISAMLGAPEGTTKSLLARARNSLAGELGVDEMTEVADRGEDR